MKTQTTRILGHLRQGHRLTQSEALERYGIARLAARIYDLREDGHDISAHMEERTNRFGEPVKIAVYTLRKSKAV